MPYVNLKREAICADCGATLPTGTRARWYPGGKVYGLKCHADLAKGKHPEATPPRTAPNDDKPREPETIPGRETYAQARARLFASLSRLPDWESSPRHLETPWVRRPDGMQIWFKAQSVVYSYRSVSNAHSLCLDVRRMPAERLCYFLDVKSAPARHRHRRQAATLEPKHQAKAEPKPVPKAEPKSTRPVPKAEPKSTPHLFEAPPVERAMIGVTFTDARALADVLIRAARFADKRSTIPVLSYVLVRTYADAPGVAYLSTTDLEGSGHFAVPGDIAGDGAALVPLKHFQDVAKAAAKVRKPLQIWTDDPGQVDVYAAMDASATPPRQHTIRTLPLEDFPTLPSLDCLEPCLDFADAVDLRATLVRALRHVSREESRFQLSGFLVEPHTYDEDGPAFLVATDGHRLSAESINPSHTYPDTSREYVAGDPQPFAPFLFPRVPAAAAVAGKAAAWHGPARLYVSAQHVALEAGGWGFIARKLEGTFPDWRLVIKTHDDEQPTGRYVFNPAALRRVAETVAPFVPERSPAVLAELNGSVILTAKDPDRGQASDALSEVDSNGVEVTMGLNVHYLIDELRSAEEASDGPATLNAWSENAQAVIRAGSYTGVVMPIRL